MTHFRPESGRFCLAVPREAYLSTPGCFRKRVLNCRQPGARLLRCTPQWKCVTRVVFRDTQWASGELTGPLPALLARWPKSGGSFGGRPGEDRRLSWLQYFTALPIKAASSCSRFQQGSYRHNRCHSHACLRQRRVRRYCILWTQILCPKHQEVFAFLHRPGL
jgi:hypothetical protein